MLHVALPSCSGRLNAPRVNGFPRLLRSQPRECRLAARAMGNSEPEVAMTLDEAQSLLGVQLGDGFEKIMAAKNRQLSRTDDQAKIFKIEAAYDLLLMQNMKQRLTGAMQVSNTVRFADVPVKKTVKQVQTSMLQQLPTGGVKVSLPPDDQLAIQGAIFAALVLWAFVQGATEPAVAQASDVAGLQQSLALIAAIYFLREKKRLGIGRSIAYGLGGLVLGSVFGGVLQSWLRVDIVPVLGMGSPGVFTAEFGILGVCAATLLLA